MFFLAGFFVEDFAFGLITYRATHFCPFFCCGPKKGTKKKRGTAKKTRAAGALPRSFCGRERGLGLGGVEREGFWGIMGAWGVICVEERFLTCVGNDNVVKECVTSLLLYS